MKQIIAFLIAIFLKVNLLFASHIMGGEITYRCIGGNNYILTYTFYRDCSGIPVPTSAFITVSSQCYDPFPVILDTVTGPIDISPTCPGEVSTCNGGTTFGVEKYIYSDTVTLPGACSSWTFSATDCCRNSLTTAFSSDMYVYSRLNNLGNVRNNTPVFLNDAVLFVCLGQTSCFNPGAYDPDGDSLVYSLVPPRSGMGPISYYSGYSATQPIKSNPAVTFNRSTGDICMTPIQLDVSVIAIVVTEYRNGILVGQVERDIQLRVIACNNNVPSLSGINGTSSFKAFACLNRPFSFWVKATDPDPNDSVKITWDESLPGATLTTFSANRDSALLTWTPTIANLGQTYCFSITVKDNHCPYFGTQSYSYCLKVDYPKVFAGYDFIVFCGDYTTLSAVGSGGIAPYSYNWDNSFTGQTFFPVSPGRHVVTITDSVGCTNQDTVDVYADSSSIIKSVFDADSSCDETPITFTNLSTGGGINNYQWNFGDGTTSNLQNPPLHTYPGPGIYNTQLFISSIFGCRDSITKTVIVYPNPTLLLKDTAICYGNNVNLVAISNASSFNWSTGNATSIINVSPTTSTTYSITVTNFAGCTASDSATVNIYPTPVASFVLDSTYYLNENIFIQNTSYSLNGGMMLWTWNIDGTISHFQDANCSFTTPGNYNVSLIAVDDKNCMNITFGTIRILDIPITAIYIPNSFSPNRDGKNDYFKVYGENITYVKVEIFDRWGLEIYSWEGVDGGWDGTYKGEIVQNDTYVYKVYAEGTKGFKKEYTGKITIIK